MQEYASLLWIVAIGLVFYLIIIRPATKRQKAAQELQSGLVVGDEVMLTSGVFGTVAELTDDHIGVEVAPGVVLRVVRGAIGSKINRAGDEDTLDDSRDDSSDHSGDDSSDAPDTPDQGEN